VNLFLAQVVTLARAPPTAVAQDILMLLGRKNLSALAGAPDLN
jgi:hypothetical protein